MDEDQDPDSDFTIRPVFADATLRVLIYDGPIDPAVEIESSLTALQESIVFGDLRALVRWGAYEGNGAELDGIIDGDPDRLRLFAASPEGGGFEIWTIVEEAAAEKMEPGFRLAEETLRRLVPGGADVHPS